MTSSHHVTRRQWIGQTSMAGAALMLSGPGSSLAGTKSAQRFVIDAASL